MIIINEAMAEVVGGEEYPEIRGLVTFCEKKEGVLVTAEIWGLPKAGACEGDKEGNFFAFHIHEGTDCGGTAFADSKGHYNPDGFPHPCHRGDLPSILANKAGYAYSVVLTDRFGLDEIIGRTVIIHSGSDDFKTQPSGASGDKIACGVIRKI